MRTLVLASLALLTAASATAGTLTIEKRGILAGWVWVDGEEQDKVRNRRPLELEVDDGEHEVWIALERGGTVTRCHGIIDVPAPGATVSITDGRGCDGLSPGFGRGADSAFRGSSVDFSITGVEAWVQVDGGRPMALPSMPFLLNLDPGAHTIVLFNDVMGGSIFDQGTVTLEKGDRLPVICNVSGCTGFDQPPQKIEIYNVVQPAPSGINIDVTLPSVNIDVNAPVDVTMDASSGSTTQSSSSTSSNQSCCVNGAFYDCPSAEAVYQCSGAFMACMMDCGLMDMECPDKCMDSHPLDPSQCSRRSSGDSSCSN